MTLIFFLLCFSTFMFTKIVCTLNQQNNQQNKREAEVTFRPCVILMPLPSLSPSLSLLQITVFRMGSEGHQDIDLAILTALLKGGCGAIMCVCWSMSSKNTFISQHPSRHSFFFFNISLYKNKNNMVYFFGPQLRCMHATQACDHVLQLVTQK